MVRRIAPLVVLLACGDPASPVQGDAALPGDAANHTDEHAAGGTRLKVVWFHSSDDTWQPSARMFWDSTLGEYCYPNAWSDGVVRCTPDGASTVFQDAGCAGRVGRAALHGDTPPGSISHFITIAWVDGAARISALYGGASGPSTAHPAKTYGRTGDGTCAELGPGPYVYYSLGAAIPPATLATLHLDDPPGAARLVALRWTSDDGLRVEVGVRDRQLDTSCDLIPSSAGATARCAPATDTFPASQFSDAACTSPVVMSSLPTLPWWPYFVFTESQAGCRQFRAVEPMQVPSGPSYVSVANECTAQTTPDSFVAATSEPLALEQVSRTVEDGGRYRRIAISTADVATVAETLLDTEQGVECRIGPNNTCTPVSRPATNPCP